nr:hypothetical protein GCM10020241_44510 [Streptoalloteichus tenebrarius]
MHWHACVEDRVLRGDSRKAAGREARLAEVPAAVLTEPAGVAHWAHEEASRLLRPATPDVHHWHARTEDPSYAGRRAALLAIEAAAGRSAYATSGSAPSG